MAFVEFYMQTTGSNTNAGSTTDDASVITAVTNKDWDNGTGSRFTGANGDFTGVTVGMWASIYADGAAATGFVSKITGVDATNAAYIDVSKTADKLGTAPTAAATGRSCKVGGAWASLAGCCTFAAATLDFGCRINIKAGTYSQGSTEMNLNITGTAAFPCWLRGYNTTIGDIDADNSLTKPYIVFTTADINMKQSFQVLSNLDVTGASSGNSVVVMNANHQMIRRCCVTATLANSSNRAVHINGAVIIDSCYLSATSSAAVVNVGGQSVRMVNCDLYGGLNSIAVTNGLLEVSGCTFRETAQHGISAGAVSLSMFANNKFYKIGGGNGTGSYDGINFSAAPGYNVIFSGNSFDTVGRYGINNAGTDSGHAILVGNTYNACASGTVNGFTLAATAFEQTNAATQVTGATDMTPAVGSNERASAQVGGYEPAHGGSVLFTGYRDRGAVQSQAAAGGSIIVIDD